ncbi:MAG TPA: hypothetical protein VKX17_22860 [Planctomycetota bacterium]|nr:hypothetical protein [Planctomycetota bacterium]
MFNPASKFAAAAFLFAFLAGCGGSQSSSFTPGGAVVHNPNQYKPLDKELVAQSNTITVYSTPETARRVMKRQPDQTVNEENGVVTQYYKSDDSPNAERLRLRYANGHLIGKEIVPPTSVNTDPVLNSTNTLGNTPYDTTSNPADNANAALNNRFNSQINASNKR